MSPSVVLNEPRESVFYSVAALVLRSAAAIEKVEMKRVVFSDCGKFRSLLMEVWDSTKPILPWCLLNPSTAGEEKGEDDLTDDPTWRKGRGFSKRLGYGGQVFVNPWDFVATDFADLRRAGYPVSASNDAYILEACAMGDGKVVVAWGRNAKGLSRPGEVLSMIRKAGYQTVALAVTKDGLPGHPLMLPYTCQLTPYLRAAAA